MMNKLKIATLSCFTLLAALSGFGQCGATGDTIFVTSQAELDDLSICTNISGSLYINDGDIENLSSLSSLESIEEHLILSENISLLSLQGLDQLEFIGGDLKLISNFTLQNISNLSSLAEVGGDIYIESNLGLDNLDGLQQLNALNGSFEIYDNPTIESLTGFENLTYVAGDFILNEFQDMLTDLTALSNLGEVGGSFEIHLRGISTLEGLESLQTIGNDLRIDSTLLLFDVDPLENLQTIGGSLIVEDNESLFTIGGMTSLQQIDGDVSIINNPGLSNCCCLKPLIDDEPIQVGGEINLQSNATGCNTEAEILQCIIDGVGEFEESELKVMVDNKQLQIFLESSFSYRIVDLSGRILKAGSSNSGKKTVDLSELDRSLVVIQVLTPDGQTFTRKVLI